MRLEGKVAFISGGARGIGAAIARLFAREGASVVIGDILERDGIQTETQIQEAGGEVRFVHMDVRNSSQWQHAINTAVSRYGKLNILVNNAGISRSGTVEDMPVETWDEIMSINNRGMFFGVKTAIPHIRTAGGGSIINVSSQFGIVGTDIADPAYVASKGSGHAFHKGAGRSVRQGEYPGQFIAPGAYQDAGQRLPVRPGAPQSGAALSAHGTSGRSGGSGVCRPLSGLRRVVLRHRGRAAGGRRLDSDIGLSTLVI